ncbi:hypothetical protein [Pluralibacter gergoviae]|uniref:hypothetical protein n=1 Tax=Pluralibacter gergoviae TaxID=61647 RepID=UPI00069D26C1|nr:hypothetical protein [Pluralibacter gergoviae]ELN2734860.1 hypothetical protein [Pluralibacter gergoviae]
MKFITAENAIDVMIKNMNHDEKKEYLNMLMARDYKKLDSIHRQHGFLFPIPIDGLMSNDEAEKIAEGMIKSSVTSDDIVATIFKDFPYDNLNRVSVRSPDEILKELHHIDVKSVPSEPMNSFLSQSLGDDTFTVMKAYMCANISGCENLKKDLLKLYTKMLLTSYHSKAITIADKKVIISEDRSKAKKGKTNKHHTEALKIAGDTWAAYPNASLAGVAEEVYSYLHNKYNGVPSADTVKTWLKDSGLNPDVKPKNRQFKLVVNGEREI